MLTLLTIILCVVYLGFITVTYSSKSKGDVYVKIALASALLFINILQESLWISIIWGFNLLLQIISLMISDFDEEDEPSESIEEERPLAAAVVSFYEEKPQYHPSYYKPESPKPKNKNHCRFCGTSSYTDIGNCNKCGAPFD